MAEIKSNLKKDNNFTVRDKFHRDLISGIETKGSVIELGGGQKLIEKIHNEKKLHCRERINLLTDKNSAFLEIGKFTAYGMYSEYGGAPS
ncbi:MAG: hypothetical protein MUE56_03350, partial [Ignavibacteria bacterium]|nr:hypothetical protein [Ignavibacteria bacterium]